VNDQIANTKFQMNFNDQIYNNIVVLVIEFLDLRFTRERQECPAAHVFVAGSVSNWLGE
jgi:hypothetical protein